VSQDIAGWELCVFSQQFKIIYKMNPAEEIVKFWLQMNGYFLQSSIRLPRNKEIDILAIDTKGNKFHIEVSVSVRMANYKFNAKELAKKFSINKFLSISKEVKSKIGSNYQKKFVVGKVLRGNKDIRDEFITECKKLNIDVLKFDDILKEVSDSLSTHSHLNPIIKAIQLSKIFNY